MTSELDLNEQSQLVNHLYREISNLAIEPEPLFQRDYQMFGRFEMYLLKFEKVVADKKTQILSMLRHLVLHVTSTSSQLWKEIKKCFEVSFGEFFGMVNMLPKI